MKTNRLIYLLIVSVICIIGCSDEEEDNRIEGISNLKAMPGKNNIELTWDHPTNETLAYIDIDYMYAEESQHIRYEDTGSTSGNITITVPEANKRDIFYFTLTSWNKNGVSSYPATIKSKAISLDTQVMLNVLLEAIEIEPIRGGVKVIWENSDNIAGQIKISYSYKGTHEVYLNALDSPGEATIEVYGTEATFIIEVIAEEGITSSYKREIIVELFGVYKLSQEKWKVIAYSSQTAESGDGAAVCLIDGTNKTSWRATTTGSVPEWVIIDLGEEVMIERFSVQRTSGSNANTAWDIMFSVDVVPDPDTWLYEWHYYNTQEDSALKIEFDRSIEEEQIYPLKETVRGRYIKFAGTRISNSYAIHFGELYIYGYYLD